MPLYTYVAIYNGNTYVTQERHSNFKGFPSTWDSIPGIAPCHVAELSENSCQGDFMPIPNKNNVWQKSFMLGDRKCVVIAVETKT